ncbi:DUF945 family protein [Pistricoccus aurantiacus]|uniref:DUF945 family protein n=1 Tax=Pistricoccus aurantiacus TaxID=1883414 RepID=UPI00363CA408
MGKKGWILGAVILVGGSYLVGQAVSSHIFEREFDQAIDSLNTRSDLRIERRDVEPGWFSSSGMLRITPLARNDWRATFPYRANHNVFFTSVEGEFELDFKQPQDQEEGGQTIRLTELLGADPIAWQANYHTLSGKTKGKLLLEEFSNQTSGGFIEGKGATITLNGSQDDMMLEGAIAPWSFSDKATILELAEITFASNYRQENEGKETFTQGHLALEGVQLQQPGGPEVEIDELRYEGTAELGAENLALSSRLYLSEMRVDGQPALAGDIDFSLTHIDAAAYRDFESALRQELDLYVRRHSQASTDEAFLSDRDMKAILERLEPQLLAMLANSPRLTLEKLNVTSPLLDIRSQLSGELRFTAENSQALSPAELPSLEELRRWQRHLNGQFLWQGVPALMALQLGLSLDNETIEITIDDGRVSLDGQPLSPLL